jgi:hypothetical protein
VAHDRAARRELVHMSTGVSSSLLFVALLSEYYMCIIRDMIKRQNIKTNISICAVGADAVKK